MPILRSGFRPHPLLRNRHLQTIGYQLVPFWPEVDLDRERFELPDGDFLDLHWSRQSPGPIVLLLHGLNGSLRSGYSRRVIQAFIVAGFRVIFMHFRGCSGEPNRLARSYHSGDTGDLTRVLELVTDRYPASSITAFGVSLGGNVLLKYLGERGSDTPLTAAAAASVPFTLSNAAETLQHGFARLYHQYLLRGLIVSARRKFRRIAPPFPLPNLGALRTIYEFDDQITAPLHGFDSAEDYYARSSCRGFLAGIRIPTLVLHAKDDPFMTPDAIPEACELPESVQLELTEHGGHMGFIGSSRSFGPCFWMEQRIPAFLRSCVDAAASDPASGTPT